jgi:hypothetical protein
LTYFSQGIVVFEHICVKQYPLGVSLLRNGTSCLYHHPILLFQPSPPVINDFIFILFYYTNIKGEVHHKKTLSA